MSYGGWYSKNDVLKDLRKATGKRALEIDERSVLFGEQPPPQQCNALSEEDELQLLRLCGNCKPATQDSIGTPDLAGITKMLRMVDDLAEAKSQPESPKPTENPTKLLTITKLNPESKEFVPMCNNIYNKTSSVKEIISKDTRTKCAVKEAVSNNTVKTEGCDTFTLSEGRIDKNKLTDKEIKEMRDKLKSKISATSNAACVRIKRERNMAIATLLKLYSQAPKAAVEQKPKLMSPAYFEQSIEKYSIDKSSPKEEEVMKNSIEKICFTQDFLSKKPQNGVITNDLKVEDTHISDIAASVDRVQKWLRDSEYAATSKNIHEKPNTTVKVDDIDEKGDVPKTSSHVELRDKQKGPLYLGAITFKRKASSSKPASPNSTDSTEQRKLENGKTPKCGVYKPSPYATELNKKYLERSKLQDSLKQDLWTLLETQLNAKDEETINKQAKAVEASPEDCVE